MTNSSAYDRRRFLTGAAIGGATIIGASALGATDAEAAFDGPGPTLDPAVEKSEFAEGRIGAIQGSTLFVAGSDGETYKIRVTPGTSVWKVQDTSIDAAEVGDGLYARGVGMPDGTIAADAIWINIVNIYTTIKAIGRNRLELEHNGKEFAGHVVPGTTVASTMSGSPSRDLSILQVGKGAQVLGAWRPADDSVDVVRVWVGH